MSVKLDINTPVNFVDTTTQVDPERSPYFGRKWKLSVIKDDGSAFVLSDSTKEDITGALRVTFKVEKHAYHVPLYADISVWNLTGDTEAAIMKQGQRVILEAGYKNGPYGKIFDGRLFQPIRDRQNVVDYVLTLHCIDGLDLLSSNFISSTVSPGANGLSQRDQLKHISENSDIPIPIQYITRDLKVQTLPRGKVFFGEPKDYLQEIAEDNNGSFFIADGALSVYRITDVSEEEALVLSPSTGLIGTPQQIADGIAFRCLLNPSIGIFANKPLMHVKLDESLVRMQKAQLDPHGHGQLLTMLDQDMVCKVIKVDYIGDTRGNDWYCDVIGVNGDKGRLPLFLTDVDTDPR